MTDPSVTEYLIDKGAEIHLGMARIYRITKR